MAHAPRHLRVFLASPGDVADEREIALAVLDDLQYDPLLHRQVTIEHVAWDKKGAGAPILAGVTPQDSIRAGMPRPRECDIVVVIFWSRMGTPLPPSYVKADGSRYESGTEWEYDDGVAGFRETGSPYVLLYRRGQEVLLNPDLSDFTSRLEQYEKVKRFFAGLQDADGSASGGYTSYNTPGDFRGVLENDLKSLVARIVATPRGNSAPGDTALPEPWPGSPFPGLRAFTAADAPIFFGREREIDALAARIHDHPFVAVVGASGSGKSSLIAAGVIPRLQLTAGSAGAPEWLVLHFTPDRLGSGDPFASFAAALLHELPHVRHKSLAVQLREEPEVIGNLLTGPVLVFVDQFEELYTTIRPDLRLPFIQFLERLVGVEGVRVVITVRADFYGNCVETPVLARLVENSTFPLAAPGVAALYDMITRPAARAALSFEAGLAPRILDDTGQEPGALALMAYTLDELYRRTLTLAAYEDIGGVQGAIGKRSESVFSELGDEEKNALPGVFRELVEVDARGTATRQRASLSRVASTPAARRLTDALTDARLLVQSRGEHNEPVVEVAHEALFRSWARLADWIREAQDDLRLLRQVRIAAVEWDRNGRRDDFLWSHERLVPVYALRDRMKVDFENVVAEFIRPEFERIADKLRAQQQYFRQRPHIERLAAIGPAAAPTLVKCLQYAKTRKARLDMYDALIQMRDVAVPQLLIAANLPEFSARPVVMEALSYVDPGAAARDVLDWLAERNPAIQSAAALLAAHSRSEEAVPALLQALKAADVTVRHSALYALGTFASRRAVDGVLETLRDDSQLRNAAFVVLRDLATRRQHYVAALAGHDDYLRVQKLIVRNKILGEPEVGAAVTAAVRPFLAETDSFRAAAEILANLRHPDATAFLLEAAGAEGVNETLLEWIGQTDDPVVVQYAASLLRAAAPTIQARGAVIVHRVAFRLGYRLAPDPSHELRTAVLQPDLLEQLANLASNEKSPGSREATQTLTMIDRVRHL